MSFFNDLFGGLGAGVLSLVGLGRLSDPLGDLRSELSQAQDDQNEMLKETTLTNAQLNIQTLQEMFNLQSSAKNSLKGTMELNDLLLWQGLKQDNFFIAVVAATVILIVLYLLFEKKCC